MGAAAVVEQPQPGRAGLLVGLLLLVNSSGEAGRLWGDLSATGKLRGRSHPINDTWIAACCLAEGLPLATLNTKDYTDFATHHASP